MSNIYIAMASLETDAHGEPLSAVRVYRYATQRSAPESMGGFELCDRTGIYKKNLKEQIAYQFYPNTPDFDTLPPTVAGGLVAAYDVSSLIENFFEQADKIQISPAALKTFIKNYLAQLETAITRLDAHKGVSLRGRGRESFLNTVKTFHAQKLKELEHLAKNAHITRELRKQHIKNIGLEVMPRRELKTQAKAQGLTVEQIEQEQKWKAFSSGDGGAVYVLLGAMDLLNDIFREARGDQTEFPYDKFLSIKQNDPAPVLPREHLNKKGYVYLIDTPPTRDFVFSVYEETVFDYLGLPTTGRKGKALLRYIDSELRKLRDGEKNSTISLFNFRSSTEEAPLDESKLLPEGKRRYTPRGKKTLWQFWKVSYSLYAEGLRFKGENRLDFSHYGRTVYASILESGFSLSVAGKIARVAFYIDNLMWLQIDHLRALKNASKTAEFELQCPDGIARITGKVSELPLPTRKNDRSEHLKALKKALADGAGITLTIAKKGHFLRYEAARVLDRIPPNMPEVIAPQKTK